MSADPTPPAAPRYGHADHPLAKAWATWQAWSTSDAWRTAAEQAFAAGESDPQVEPLANHALGGPDPLAALRANHAVAITLISQQWQAIRDARERGRGWHEIGAVLGLAPDEARDAYTRTLQRQRQCAADYPDLAGVVGYQPRWAELARDNHADRAHQRQPQRGRAPHSREADHER